MKEKKQERIMKQEYMKQNGKLAEIYESIKNRMES